MLLVVPAGAAGATQAVQVYTDPLQLPSVEEQDREELPPVE